MATDDDFPFPEPIAGNQRPEDPLETLKSEADKIEGKIKADADYGFGTYKAGTALSHSLKVGLYMLPTALTQRVKSVLKGKDYISPALACLT